MDYTNIRSLIKTLDYNNIILAIYLTKKTRLKKQVLHDIQCLFNYYYLIPKISNKYIRDDFKWQQILSDHENKFKSVVENKKGIEEEFKKLGFVLKVNKYKIMTVRKLIQ